MKQISVLIKPASSLCNLRCRYCFYADVSQNREISSQGIMSEDTAEKLVECLAADLEENGIANISFQGGEPTVAGIGFFRRFAKLTDRHPGLRINWSIQTNATLLDEEFAQFFKERNFLVGVSLDGYQRIHDQNRYDAEKKSVFFRVLKAIDLLEDHGVEYNILTVVTRELAKHPEALFDFYKNHRFHYIQLIPCLPELDGSDPAGLALTPAEYAFFYNTFFDAWQKHLLKGGQMSVNLFENIAGMILGKAPYQCGMLGRCTQQFVIEGNGDVYPCDFYCLDEWKLGNVRDSSFEEMRNSANGKRFPDTSECRKEPCTDCRYINVCHGGCRRQNVCWLNDTYCGYQKVLDHIVPRIADMLAERIGK